MTVCFVLPLQEEWAADLAVVPAIFVAVGVYALCVVAFRVVTYDDVAMLPKGEKLARLLRLRPSGQPRHLK